MAGAGRSGGYSPLLSSYRFVGAAAAQTMTGFFMTSDGVRTGAMFTLAVSNAALVKFADVAGGIPADADGVVFNLSGDVRFSLLDSSGAAPSLGDVQNYGVYWYAAAGPFSVGRVG